MVKSKKLLSFFLAVVMVLSVFTVMASAYTVGEAEGTADIDIKYTVEKVDTVPTTDAGSVEWSADNIYAVTAWMKSSKGVDTLTVPFHYNKTLFAPITLSDGTCTYPYGAGMDQDTYYTDMGEGTIYAYSLGDYMNNTGMYTATGATATTKALAKCIGLGNENSDGVTVISELVSPDHPNYGKWGAGLPENTGVMYVNLDVCGGTKTAYLNTIEGITTSTDWNRMVTVYVEAIVEDVTGAEIGVFTDDCFTVDGNYDGTGSSYFVSATSYSAVVPTMNIVSNAVVTAASPVYAATSQIRYNGPVDGDYAPFDIRTRAAMTAEDFAAICGDDETAKTAITDVGFVYAADSVTFDLATAQAVATGTAAEGYVKKSVSHIQKTGTEYVWTCLITGADYAAGVNSLGYITVNGTTYYFDAAYATDFSVLYDTWSSKIPTA